jgi:hypothetical protein
MSLIGLDDLYRRRLNRQAAAIMTIQVIEIQTSAATMEIFVRPSMTVDGPELTERLQLAMRYKISIIM